MNKIDLTYSLDSCVLCPRMCRAARSSGKKGVCGADDTLCVARIALHLWEEPPLVGDTGSGTIFFGNCSLKCAYCQNEEISHQGIGYSITIADLAQGMLSLQDQGAANINLVTPAHYVPQIVDALKQVKQDGLQIPVVYNTSGYERPELIATLHPYVDVWLTDFKYSSPAYGKRYSHVENYVSFALDSLYVMYQSLVDKGGYQYEEGLMKRGIIVRHLVIPALIDNSLGVLDILNEHFGDSLELSIMNQFTPLQHCSKRFPELNRTVTDEEYERVLSYAYQKGFSQVYWQESGTADESFIPPFDGTGLQAFGIQL